MTEIFLETDDFHLARDDGKNRYRPFIKLQSKATNSFLGAIEMHKKSNQAKKEIIFIQPAYGKYRKPFFEKFLSHYNMTFYFMRALRQCESHLRSQLCQGFLERCHLPRNGKDPNRLVHILREYVTRPSALLFLLMKSNYPVIITSISSSPQTIISLFVSKIRKSKCVLWIEEWSSPKTKSLISILSILASTFVLRNSDAVVVEGTPQYRYVRKFNVPKQKVFFSNHCSLDYSTYSTKNLRNELNIKDSLTVLYLGRIIKIKGLDILIEAFSRTEQRRNDVALIVCGDGDFLPFCKQLANKLKIKNAFFLGSISREEDIASVYKAADVFVLPSCTRSREPVETEGWGLVINEAMSMGIPIITTDAVGAAQDLVKDNINGYVVKNGDSNELYQALTKILGDEKLRRTMGKNSRKIFEEFNDFNKMFEGFRQAIDYVTQQRGM